MQCTEPGPAGLSLLSKRAGGWRVLRKPARTGLKDLELSPPTLIFLNLTNCNLLFMYISSFNLDNNPRRLCYIHVVCDELGTRKWKPKDACSVRGSAGVSTQTSLRSKIKQGSIASQGSPVRSRCNGHDLLVSGDLLDPSLTISTHEEGKCFMVSLKENLCVQRTSRTQTFHIPLIKIRKIGKQTCKMLFLKCSHLRYPEIPNQHPRRLHRVRCEAMANLAAVVRPAALIY